MLSFIQTPPPPPRRQLLRRTYSDPCPEPFTVPSLDYDNDCSHLSKSAPNTPREDFSCDVDLIEQPQVDGASMKSLSEDQIDSPKTNKPEICFEEEMPGQVDNDEETTATPTDSPAETATTNIEVQPQVQTPRKQLQPAPRGDGDIEVVGKYFFRKGIRIRDYKVLGRALCFDQSPPESAQFQCRDGFEEHEVWTGQPRLFNQARNLADSIKVHSSANLREESK